MTLPELDPSVRRAAIVSGYFNPLHIGHLDMMDDLRGIASKLQGTSNLRDKFKAVPWTSEDGKPFPDDQHVALTHWSIGGVGTTDPAKQVGVWQFCSAPSGDALEKFMEKYPYMDSAEPAAI